jgi:hypothetical protein
MVREETGGCGPCEERAPLRARAHTALATYALHHTCWRALAFDCGRHGLWGFCDACFYIPTLKKLLFVFPAHRVTFALVTYDLLYGV